MAKNLYRKYTWLIDVINSYGPITYEEINAKWLRSSFANGENLPIRTLHNHRDAIAENFGIVIACNKSYQYYIEDNDKIENGAVQKWLLSCLSINNQIQDTQAISRRIILENIPSGQQFLTSILNAMQEGYTLTMEYQNFWIDSSYQIEIEPYFVKLFKQIWYLVGRNPFNDKIKIYALDRIKSLEQTRNKFTLPDDFEPQLYFQNNFGIIKGDEPASIIQVKVLGDQVKYWRSLPRHHSQTEIETHSDYSVFSLYLHPTFDFLQMLLSQGNRIEVISPESLRQEIAQTIMEMVKLYQ